MKLLSHQKALPILAESRISKCVVSFPSLKVKPLYFQTLNYHCRPCHLWDHSVPPFLPQVCLVLFRLGSVFSFCTFLMPSSFWIVLETNSKKCHDIKKGNVLLLQWQYQLRNVKWYSLVQHSKIKKSNVLRNTQKQIWTLYLVVLRVYFAEKNKTSRAEIFSNLFIGEY